MEIVMNWLFVKNIYNIIENKKWIRCIKLIKTITFSTQDVGLKPVGVQDVNLTTKVEVVLVIGTLIRVYTGSLVTGVESMVSMITTYGSQIWQNVIVSLDVSGFWKSMTHLGNVLQGADLLRGAASDITTSGVESNKTALIHRIKSKILHSIRN